MVAAVAVLLAVWRYQLSCSQQRKRFRTTFDAGGPAQHPLALSRALTTCRTLATDHAIGNQKERLSNIMKMRFKLLFHKTGRTLQSWKLFSWRSNLPGNTIQVLLHNLRLTWQQQSASELLVESIRLQQ